MVKDKLKESEFQDDDFAEEEQGPLKSGKHKAGSKNSGAERQGESTMFYLHSLLLFGGRCLNKVLDAYNSLFDLSPKVSSQKRSVAPRPSGLNECNE